MGDRPRWLRDKSAITAEAVKDAERKVDQWRASWPRRGVPEYCSTLELMLGEQCDSGRVVSHRAHNGGYQCEIRSPKEKFVVVAWERTLSHAISIACTRADRGEWVSYAGHEDGENSDQ